MYHVCNEFGPSTFGITLCVTAPHPSHPSTELQIHINWKIQ